jgi:hypothetical protein
MMGKVPDLLLYFLKAANDSPFKEINPFSKSSLQGEDRGGSEAMQTYRDNISAKLFQGEFQGLVSGIYIGREK